MIVCCMSNAAQPLAIEHREAVLNLVARIGERAAVEHLQISSISLGHVIGGLPIQRGTVALIRERVAAINQSGTASCDVVAQGAREHKRR